MFEFTDGVIVISEEGTIVEVGSDLEVLLGIASLDLIDTKLGTILDFEGFEVRSEDLILGDAKRFRLARQRGQPALPAIRFGRFITRKGRFVLVRTKLEPAATCPILRPSSSCLNLFYSVIELPELAVASKLPGNWANAINFVVTLWQKNAILTALVIVAITTTTVAYISNSLDSLVDNVKSLVRPKD